MFGRRPLKEIEAAKSLPFKEVTPNEFISMAGKAGIPEEQAKLHIKVSKTLGSHVKIGSDVLKVKHDGTEGD
jgi:hypothetical protein